MIKRGYILAWSEKRYLVRSFVTIFDQVKLVNQANQEIKIFSKSYLTTLLNKGEIVIENAKHPVDL